MKQIIAILLLSLVALSVADVLTAHRHFLTFMTEHSKTYDSDEEFLHRFNVFKQNLKNIEEWNKEGEAVFGVTQFSDLTSEEFASRYLMKNMPPKNESVYKTFPTSGAPATFDWRSKGGVSPVKNQGQCGSCWAFSATENIESVYHIGGHPMPTLSPQQIVDCDKDCYGCGGGWPYRAFNYVVRQGGQDTESSYPYTARNGQCRFNPSSVGAKIRGYHTVSKDEHQIQNGLSTTAPFSICVDAARWSQYRGGVMRSTQCGRSIDHCVQLVGYEANANPPYWIVRNSWGTGWGISGYIYLEMFKNTCAMSQDVTTAYL